MAIVEDYDGIAAELRRIRAERFPEAAGTPQAKHDRPVASEQHPMRATLAGELLYRRLVLRRRR